MSASTPDKRESPFLQRVWRRTVGTLGGLASVNGEKSMADDLSPRATKRRRVAMDSLGSLDPAVVTALGPLFGDPSQVHLRALRVQVLRVGHDSLPDPGANGLFHGNGSPVKKDVPFKVVRARCKLTIFKHKARVETRSLYCDSQKCEVKMFRDSSGASRQARIYLQQPFQIPAEKLFIERDDLQGFMLADGYLLQTELESAGDPNWPPFDLLPDEEQHSTLSTPPRQWVLSSTFLYTYAKGRITTPVRLRKFAGEETETGLAMETDLRWSIPASQQEKSLMDLPPLKMDILPYTNSVLVPLTDGHTNGRADNSAKSPRDEDNDAEDENEDDGEAVTPSRSLRMRGKQQNYNLKLLSDKARGKEQKERKKRDSGHVTWVLPLTRRAETEKWSCIRCSQEHNSIAQLKEHIVQHEEFKFTTDCTNRGGWRITISQHNQETPLASRTAEFLDPPSLNDYEYDSPTEHSTGKNAPRLQPKSKVALVKHAESGSSRPAKQKIPDNKQQMYDRLSKVVLKPLSMVDEPPVNNAWLVQKHRDIIKDYTDVSPNEKEYISEWDTFVLMRKATFSPHFNDIYLDFIQEKASWLAASQHRMDEAMRHLAYLNARDALEKVTIGKNLGVLKKARSQVRQLPQAESTSPKADTHFSKSGCGVCGQPTPGPKELICSNWDCDYRWYHTDCVETDAQEPIDRANWRCKRC